MSLAVFAFFLERLSEGRGGFSFFFWRDEDYLIETVVDFLGGFVGRSDDDGNGDGDDDNGDGDLGVCCR